MLPSASHHEGRSAPHTTPTRIQLKRGGTVLLSLCELTPWERWRHYGVRPYKLVLHLLLLLLATARILHESRRWVPYSLSGRENVCHFFFPAKCAGANRCGATPDLLFGVDSYADCYLFSVGEMTEALGSLVYRYYHIGEIALANYGLVMEKTPPATASNTSTSANSTMLAPQPPLLTVSLRPAKRAPTLDEELVETQTYALTEGYWGPVDTRHHSPEEVRAFFKRLIFMDVHFHLEDEVAEDALNTCYLWAVRIIYNARNKAEIAVSQESHIKGFCDSHRRAHGGLTRGDKAFVRPGPKPRRFLSAAHRGQHDEEHNDEQSGQWVVDPWAFRMNVVALLLSAALTLILLKELNDALFLLRRARALLEGARAARLRHDHHHAHPLRWRDIGPGIKFRFFNFWQVLLLLGSAIVLWESLHAVQGFRGPPMVSDGQAALRGLGAALLWIYTCRYLHHSDQLYAIILVIDNSVPRVLRMLVQIVPIFVGFTLLGVMIFGAYFPRFGSFSWAFTTLFCLWNGDAIMETADQLGALGHPRAFAVAYIVVFIVVFVYVILNILLVVVQQTLLYVQLHHRGKRTLHRLLLRRGTTDGEYADDAGGDEDGAKHPRRHRSLGTSFHLHAHNLDREEGDGTSSSSSSSSDGDGGGDGRGEGAGWGLRTGEVVAQRTFLQLLELTDLRDEPGIFFNDIAGPAQLLAEAEGRRAARRRNHSASSGSGSPPVMLPQQRGAPPQIMPGQPRQRRRSTLGMGLTG